jgi:dihydrofolate reductase
MTFERRVDPPGVLPEERRAPLVLVLAIADGGVIGKDGGLPWRIPEDLRHFKAMTMGHAIVMGRRTWDEVKKPLSGRRNIVVSRTIDSLPGAEVARTLEGAIALARTTDDEPRIIGGAAIYAAALPLATRIYLTEVHRKVEGDTFFHLDRTGWRETERRAAQEPESEGVEFVTLER